MKKFFAITLGIILIAAACNKPAAVQPVQSLVVPDSLAVSFYPAPPSPEPFVQLTWNYGVADYFNLYRSVDQKTWEKFATNYPQSGHSAVDRDYPKDAKVVYYRITSTDGKDNESQPSEIASVNISNVVTADWKTYTDSQHGFEFRYPANYSVKTTSTTGELITPGSNKNYNEASFNISWRIDGTASKSDATSPSAATKLKTDILSKLIGKDVVANFTGDPPVGSYSVSIPLKTQYLHLGAVIGQNDEPAYGGLNTNLNIFSQILSTFKLTTSATPTVINGTKGPNWTAYTGLYVNNYAKYSIQLPNDYAALEAVTPVSTNDTDVSIDTPDIILSYIKESGSNNMSGGGGLIEITAIEYNQPITADQERLLIACGGDKTSFDSVMLLGSVSASVCTAGMNRSLFILSQDRKTIITIVTSSDSSMIALADPILKTFKFIK